MNAESLIKRRLFQFVGVYTVVLLIVVYEVVVRGLQPLVWGTIAAVLMIAGFVFLLVSFKKINREHGTTEVSNGVPDRKKITRTIRSLQVWLGIMLLSFVSALWGTRGDPFLPRVIGATFNIFISYSLVVALRVQRKKLQQLDNKSTYTIQPAQGK